MMTTHSGMLGLLCFTSVAMLAVSSCAQVPFSSGIPDFLLLSPDGPRKTKYAIMDGVKLRADRNYHLNVPRFVVWSGDNEAEVSAFLKSKKQTSVLWVGFIGVSGSELPDAAAQKAVIAKFQEEGIKVSVAHLPMYPPIVDPPAPPPNPEK